MRRDAFREMLTRAVLAVTLTVLAVCALAALSPAARADGDPGSDVLVYQNLFVAADSNISIAQQVELGGLLTAASRSGFTIRVAIIATPADLGAITPLWRKPASYASFLGIELSLAYSQRLLVVMPDGFGFNWQGHSTTAAYTALGKVPVKPGGSGLAASAETAVRALASASGIRLSPTAAGQSAASSASGAAGGGAVGPSPPPGGGRPATTASGLPAWLIAVIAAAALAACAAGGWLARRAGLRLSSVPGMKRGLTGPRTLLGRWKRRARRLPRLGIPGTWVAGAFVAIAVALIGLHTLLTPAAGAAQADSSAATAGLASNPNLDPGTSLSEVAPTFTLTDQFGQPVSLGSYRGKVVILAFNDSECTTVCPLTTTALVDAKAMLGSAGRQVQLLGIEANPKATSIDDVLSYSQVHGMLYQWRYLTGSLSQLQAVWKDYSVGVTVNQNQIDHEPAIFVIDQQGRLAKLYLTQLAYSAVPQLGQLLANEVSTLLPGHPAVYSHLSYDQVAAVGPAAPAGRAGPGPALPVLRELGRGDHQPRRPARRAQRVPVGRGRRPPSRPHRDRRGQRRAVGLGAAELPGQPDGAAVLPGRDRRQRADRGRLRRAGRALVRARLSVRAADLDLGGVHLRMAQHRPPRPTRAGRARQRGEGEDGGSRLAMSTRKHRSKRSRAKRRREDLR
jgi:cytochrome oxidase Cu insertion factor (SCO1/SenC/PrrC family)